MPDVVCRACGYTRFLTKRELEFGMRCPECYGANLKPVPRRGRRGERAVAARPFTVRALVSGVGMLLIGGVVLAWGRSNWNAGLLGARLVGAGVVFLIGGVLSLIVGLVNLVKDLR